MLLEVPTSDFPIYLYLQLRLRSQEVEQYWRGVVKPGPFDAETFRLRFDVPLGFLIFLVDSPSENPRARSQDDDSQKHASFTSSSSSLRALLPTGVLSVQKFDFPSDVSGIACAV